MRTSVEGQHFEKKRIAVEAVDFTDCTFVDCQFAYSGGVPYSFLDCDILNCTFEIEGAAANTLDMLRLLYNTGRREFAESLLSKIREPYTQR